MLRNLFFGFLSLAFISSQSIAEKNRGKVGFISDIIELTAITGSEFRKPLRELLKDVGSGNLKWYAMDQVPSWLTLDLNNEVMFGVANQAGNFQFRLSVQDTNTGESAGIALIKIAVKWAPSWKENLIILGKHPEEIPFQFDLKTKLQYNGSSTLTFSITDSDGDAPWLKVDPTSGILSGTPKRPNVGTYEISVTVTTADDMSASADATGEVLKVIKPPEWIEPVNIASAKEDFEYSYDLSKHVSNPESAALSFEFTQSHPDWINLSSNGILSGTPAKKDVGDVSLSIMVKATIDGSEYTDDAKINLKVLPTNHPPSWKTNPVVLEDAFTLKNYSADLKPYTTDPDGDTLTFTKISGPDWANVSKEGIISGTADKPNIGLNTFTIEISDGEFKAQASIQTTVIKSNEPPKWLANPTVLPNAKEDSPYSFDLKSKATDPDGDTLAFKIISGPTWVTLTQDGMLSGTPLAANVGLNSFEIEVSDNISGKDVAKVQITVEHTNHSPIWKENPIELTVDEKKPMEINLLDYASDPDTGDTLSFSIVSGSNWAKIIGNLFSGTPLKENIGKNEFVVRADDNNGGVKDVKIIITVKNVNDPPYWLVNPIILPNTPEKVPYSKDVSQFAADEDEGDNLRFEKVSGPNWASISNGGVFSGTPNRPDVGLNKFKVLVRDSAGATAEVEVQVTVEKVNMAPRWTQNPITIPDAVEDAAYSYNISGYAVDDDGDSLTFKKLSGPEWISVDIDGTIFGTPPQGETGPFNLTVEARDLETGTPVKVNGKVVLKNYPPVVHQDNIHFTVKEREVFQVSLNDPKYVEDINGDNLVFTLIDLDDWINLASNGTLILSPKHEDIGDYPFKFKVSDGKLSAEAAIIVKVIRDPQKPVWKENPILFTTQARVPFSSSIADKAYDLDGVALTFTKKSGAEWLTIEKDGKISGVPADENVGENKFVVTATNDALSSDAEIIITVTKKNHEPIIHEENLHFTVKERETINIDLNDPKYLSDLDGDTLSCKLLNSVSWVVLSSDCKLTMSPKFEHIGEHVLAFSAADKEDVTNGNLYITVIRDPRPPVWNSEPIVFTATARILFREIVSDKVKDLDNLPLTFSKKSGPEWLKVDSLGNLEGTPQDSDIGDNLFVITASNDKLGADKEVLIKVLSGNHDPYWTLNPVVLPNATVLVSYKDSVAPFAKDDDGDKLTFSKISDGPSWLNVATDGTVIGTPQNSHIGLNEFDVRVEDTHGAFSDVKVQITVERPNKPPKWLEDPVIMADAFIDSTYSFDLSPLATDPDGDTLKFKKASGPEWLVVNENGKCSGSPVSSDLGEYSGILEVCDHKVCVQAGALGRVIKKNVPPVINEPNLHFTIKEDEVFNVNLNDPNYISDPDGDSLTFSLISQIEWISLSSDGALTMKPLYKHIGDHEFDFTVKDPTHTVNGKLFVKVLRNPSPPKCLEDPIKFQAVIKKEFQDSLVSKIVDEDGITLIFSKKAGGNWLTVSANGTISGTPEAAQLGENPFIVTAKNDLLSTDCNVVVNVISDNKPPYWTADPVTLPDATPQVTYAQSVAPFAKDPEGEKLTFEKISGPEWAYITTSGLVIGTPELSDQGMNTLVVRAMDPEKAYADASVQIIVSSGTNHPPVWLEDPIALGKIQVQKPFSFDLSKFAKDEDGDKLTFKKVNGPSWLLLSNDGIISGIPKDTDVGEFTAEVSVTDLKSNPVIAHAFGVVVDTSNHPPVITPEGWSFIITKNTVVESDLNQPQYVSDPDGDPLTFSMVTTEDWITLEANGKITLKPLEEHLGDHKYQVKVSDDKGAYDVGRLFVRVLDTEPDVVWIEAPIRYETFVNKPFNETLKDKAKDKNGKPLTFSNVTTLPEWLKLSSDGGLNGTPLLAHLGENSFKVRASNGTSFADATVTILVKKEEDIIDEIQIDEPIAGAPSENLWVIDNSDYCETGDTLMKKLYNDIDVFFSTVNVANIHFKGIYLSSDYCKYSRPIKSKNKDYFLRWQDNSVTDDFRYRMNISKSNKCYNSPIWAMFCFYCLVEEKLPDIYKDYFTEDVPMDVMIVSAHKDYYRKFTFMSPQHSWDAAKFADNFIDFHNKEKQPYRISAIAPECPTLCDPYKLEKEVQPKEENSYEVLTQKTNGGYYPDCSIDIEKYLRDYASKVIFRAYASAKKSIPLSHTPADPKAIKVYIGGTLIPGNTQSANDIWYYNSSEGVHGAIIIRWYLIDWSMVKPGDMIQIKYKAL